MTREEVIKYFTKRREMAQDCVADFERAFPEHKSAWRRDVELYDMAISALREQEDHIREATKKDGDNGWGRLIPPYKCRSLKHLLCHWFPRYKLWLICQATGIPAKDWQKQFALGKACPFPVGRRTGKTTAIMLRLLMLPPFDTVSVGQILHYDPDWRGSDLKRRCWYEGEYRRLVFRCYESGIPVNINVFRRTR